MQQVPARLISEPLLTTSVTAIEVDCTLSEESAMGSVGVTVMVAAYVPGITDPKFGVTVRVAGPVPCRGVTVRNGAAEPETETVKAKLPPTLRLTAGGKAVPICQ